MPGFCAFHTNLDSCDKASVSNTMHVFHNRRCVFTLGGKCKDYSYTENDGHTDVTINVPYDAYQANCVWSASGCTVDHVDNVISWTSLGSGIAKSGHTCKGTQDTKNPYKPPKFCESCP